MHSVRVSVQKVLTGPDQWTMRPVTSGCSQEKDHDLVSQTIHIRTCPTCSRTRPGKRPETRPTCLQFGFVEELKHLSLFPHHVEETPQPLSKTWRTGGAALGHLRDDAPGRSVYLNGRRVKVEDVSWGSLGRVQHLTCQGTSASFSGGLLGGHLTWCC